MLERIAEWRAYLLKRGTVRAADADELEDHLRSHVEALSDLGLAPDEAFLIAVKRIGSQSEVTREFAREHSERLWKQLVASPDSGAERPKQVRTETLVVIGLAILAALAFKMPELAGMARDEVWEHLQARNVSFYVLPCLAAYFAWKRRLSSVICAWLAAVFVAAAILVNVFPYSPAGSTELLAVLHLPIALWLPVGIAYAGGQWSRSTERMNFVRFSGELVIYFVLIFLGGMALTGLTAGLFQSIGINLDEIGEAWLPCAALGAVIVASALVELKKSVVENMAPVLTRLFAPMFAAVLLVFLGTMAWTGNALDLEREVLIGFNFALLLVLGLLLYAISARDSLAAASAFDVVLLVLVFCALALDAVLLTAMGARIFEYGSSPNKMAALGENLILMVNLAWSAWLYLRFLRGRASFAALERWQTAYLPVYSAWAGIVVVVFPPLFGFA